MTDTLSTPGLRVVAHRATAAELQTLNTSELSDQALVMVGLDTAGALYRLNKLATPTQGPNVIVPGSGPGQWELLAAPGGAGATTQMFAAAGSYVIFPGSTPGLWEVPSGQLFTVDGPSLTNWTTSGAGSLVYTAGPGAGPYFAEMSFTIARTAGSGAVEVDVALEFNSELAGTNTTVLRQTRLTVDSPYVTGVIRGRFTPDPGCQLRPVTKVGGGVGVRMPFLQVSLTPLAS